MVVVVVGNGGDGKTDGEVVGDLFLRLLLLLPLLLVPVACLKTFVFRGGRLRLSTYEFPCAPLIQFFLQTR